MAVLTSDWQRHFRLLLWNRWMEFNETWQETRSQRLRPSLCFSGRLKKKDGHPGLWLAETFSTSSLKSLNGIQRNLTGKKKTSMSSYKFVVFLADWKNKMAALASDWLRHFRLLLWNRLTEFDETWQEAWSQGLYQVCVFGPIEKKMAAMAHDWLRHFWLLLWNCWTGFKEIWQEARSQHLLPSCVFQSDE